MSALRAPAAAARRARPVGARYVRERSAQRAQDWAYEHPVEDHASEVVARLATGDADAKIILAYWRGVRDEPRVKDAIRAAVVQLSTKAAPWAAPLRDLASTLLPWTDEAMATLHEQDRAHLVTVRRAAEEAAERSRKLTEEMNRRNAEQFRKI